MLTALLLAALLNGVSAFSTTWPQLLLCRALMGLCLGIVADLQGWTVGLLWVSVSLTTLGVVLSSRAGQPAALGSGRMVAS